MRSWWVQAVAAVWLTLCGAVAAGENIPAEARAAEAADAENPPAGGAAPAKAAAAESAPPPYLVALDFTADRRNARLGPQIARMFRNKTARAKVCSVDTEIDWEEMAGRLATPAPDAPAAELASTAKEAFACDYLVWGEIKSADPEDRESRRLQLRCRVLDVRKGELVASRDFTLGTNFEISQAVDEVVKDFAGVPTRADVAAADPANRQEAFGPNLCPHGDLIPSPKAEPGAADKGLPGWEFPRPGNIMLRRDTDGAHCLEYDVSAGEVAEITGLFCYTPYIPVKPDTYYQVSFKVRSDAPKVIQFTKGYRDGEMKDLDKPRTLRQETFKHQVRFYGKDGEWGQLVSRPFLPRAVRQGDAPRFIRVQLYAYWPVGRVWFKDVVVRECREKK